MENNRISLLDGWRFALTQDSQAINRDFDDSSWRILDLPHDWQIEQPRELGKPDSGRQGFFPREHIGVYRYHFYARKEWKDKCIRILFDGIQHFSTVYLNGKKIGERPYGYVPFLCDLTNILDFDQENVLVVWVDNRDFSNGSWSAYGGDRWYSGAGIYRKVWLLVQDLTHIAHNGIRILSKPLHHGPNGDVPDVAGIRCDTASVSIQAELEGDLQNCEFYIAICDHQENEVFTCSLPAENIINHHFLLQKPFLWTIETPILYRAVFMLKKNGMMLDKHTVRFGIRTAIFDEEDGFVLNGKKTKLWGVNLHHDGASVGAAVPIEVWERRLKVLKSLGVNTIRASHNPMAEELYDLCDELGFLVIDELYDKWCGSNMYFDALYDEWHEQDLSTMIRRDANHPCVILWSVGNEVRGQYSELYFKCLEELCNQARREDPSRAVSTALITFVLPEYNDTTPLGKRLAILRRYSEIVDVIMANYMENYYEKLREYGIRKPIIGSEVRTYYRNDDRYPDFTAISMESPYTIVKKHDWVCGAIVWAGIDYLGESPFWPLRGWTGNLLDSTADVKIRAWYCASQWSDKPILKLAVYDESEPWDGARGAWGFPQMRSHWNYSHFEKMMHVAVMTNCDTVKLYQNNQTVRTAYLSDFPDAMVHFFIPYIPGILKAEGYQSGHLMASDTLYSDHQASQLRVDVDKTKLPADGHSVAFVDLALEDTHARRYMLEDRIVSWNLEGCHAKVLIDNGNAYSLLPFNAPEIPMHNGHIMLMICAGHEKGISNLHIRVEGFEERIITFSFD